LDTSYMIAGVVRTIRMPGEMLEGFVIEAVEESSSYVLHDT